MISAGKGSNGATTSSAALRSIWLVGWGDNGIVGFYPEGSKTAGLTTSPMERIPLMQDGKLTHIMSQEIVWEVGLAVRNFQKAGRICNFQLDTALAAGYDDDLVKHLRHLRTRVKSNGVSQAFYMDGPTWEIIEDTMAHLTQSNAIKYADTQQTQPKSFWGIPVKLCDCLGTNEAAVSAVA